MVAHYTLTVYQADDVTPWFEVSTDPAHPHPYLHPPGEYDQGEIDLLGGRALVGEMQLRIIDPQTGADQSERWLTGLLGIPAGEEGAGHSALNGRRGLLTQSDGAVVLDGVVSGVRLSETFAGFHLGLRDIRERHRRVSLFGRTGTATVLPRGVLNGYGKLPGGGWLIPPTKPLPAVYRGSSTILGQSGYFDLSGLWTGRPLDGSRTATAPPVLVLTDSMRRAATTTMVGGVVPLPIYRNIEVWWRRTSGDTSWHIITDIRPRGAVLHPLLLNHVRARVEGVDGEVEAIYSIGVAGGGFAGPTLDVPDDGESVEVLVLYVGPPTEDYPFHFEGTAGELLRNLYRGDYSDSPITTSVDEAALLALTTPVRLRLTEAPQAGRSREWIENVYRQLRAAPALDRPGRISPVTAALPDPSEVLVELTDDVCQPIPGWDHPATDAVTAVRITYPRDYRVPVEDDPLGERSAGDGLASIDVTVERRAPEWVIDLMGEQVHEIDGFLFRALGIVGSAGTIDPASGDITDETGHLEATRAAREILDRWVFGGQVSFARVMRSALPDLRPGQWVIDRRSWRPNYREGKRGGASLAQIMSVRALDPAWLEVSLVDAGPADQPLTAPTLGTPTAADDGIVTVPVTTIPTGGEAAIYYAVATSAPAWGSGAWRLAGRIGQAGDVFTPPQPAGAQVWITARGEGLGRRPSDITTPVSVTIPIVPRLHEVRITLDGGTPTVHWQRNGVAQGVRIAYWIHPPEGDPTGPATTVDVAASELGHTLGITVQPGEAITAEVTPYTGWTGSAVSGTPGPSVERSVARPREPVQVLPPQAIIDYVTEDQTMVRLRYSGQLGEGGTGPLEYRRRVGPSGSWGPGSGDGWASLPGSGVEHDVTRPTGKRGVLVYLEVRDADGRVGATSYLVEPRLDGLDDDGLIDITRRWGGGGPDLPYVMQTVDGGERARGTIEPGGGVLAEGTGIKDGRSVSTLFRHREEVMAVGGADAIRDQPGERKVDFLVEYQNTPAVTLRGFSAICYSPALASGGGKLRLDITPSAVTKTGFISRAQIRSVGSQQEHTTNFPSGYVSTVGATRVATLLPGVPGASDGNYIVRYRVEVFAARVIEDPLQLNRTRVTIAVETDDGSGFEERATFVYWAVGDIGGPDTRIYDEEQAINVPGLDSGDQIRLVIKNIELLGPDNHNGYVRLWGGDEDGPNPGDYAGVTYYTSDDAVESAIPNPDNAVYWLAVEVV